MPRYYLHVRDGDVLITDNEGVELPDLAAAFEEARASVREFAIEALKQRRAVDRIAIELHDGQGNLLGVIAFSDVSGGDELTG